MKIDYPTEELLSSGLLSCQGCGATIVMRHCLKALGKNTICTVPACCWSIIAGNWPYSAMGIPLLHTAFETAGASASGIRAALDAKGMEDTRVLAFAGDGGTFDIGLQSLSGATERNEDIVYVCYDNEAYMNTGIQRSSATPEKAWTTTTPVSHPKGGPKKNILQILSGHKIPYCATASVAWPEDLMVKVTKAAETKGTAFIHAFSPCPPGWKISSEKSIEIARLAVHTKIFPLYEIFNGEEYHINIEPKGLPVEEYLKLQGRFSHLDKDDITYIQNRVDYEWKILLQRSMMEPFHMNM